MKRRCPDLRVIYLSFIVFGLLGCGGDIDPSDTSDPERAARAPLPDHDPEATFRGQTAAALGERLEGQAEAGMGVMTLRQIAQMGVDGLPARDSVRQVFQSPPHPEAERDRADLLRSMALLTLVEMKAPEAPALARQTLGDRDFTRFSAAQRQVIQAAVTAMDADELQSDLMTLVDEDPIHAGRILRAEGLPDPSQQALAVALLDAELDDDTARFLIDRMNEMDAITDDQKVRHLLTYQGVASEHLVRTQGMLVRIGTREALDAALQIGDPSPSQRQDLIRRFDLADEDPGQASESRAESMDAMLDQAVRTQSTIEFREAINAMERMDRENQDIRGAFASGMIALSTRAATENHRAMALSRLGLYVRRNRETPLEPSLGVLLAAAGNPERSEAVRQTARDTFSESASSMVNRDPEGFFRATWALVSEMDENDDFDLPATAMMQARGHTEHARVVIGLVTENADLPSDHWAVNPAAAILIHTASIRAFNNSPEREAASIQLGRYLASPHASLEYLEPHFHEGKGELVNLETNTVPGLIGFLEPTIFADHATVNHQFMPEELAGVLLIRPRWLNRDAEATRQWKEFLGSVVEADANHFSPAAEQALAALR